MPWLRKFSPAEPPVGDAAVPPVRQAGSAAASEGRGTAFAAGTASLAPHNFQYLVKRLTVVFAQRQYATLFDIPAAKPNRRETGKAQ